MHKLKYKYIDVLVLLYSKVKNISPRLSKKLEKYIIKITKEISNETYNIMKR